MALDKALEIRNLWYRYPGHDWTLRGISLSLSHGELTLIVGGSGSGKTTLVRAITGSGVKVHGGELRGEVRVAGRDVLALNDRLCELVQVVAQDPRIHFVEQVVGEDLGYYAEELYGVEEGRRRLEKALELTGTEGLLDRLVFELSGGQLRRLAMAKALISDPILLVLDEPMMWMDEEGESQVVEVMRRLRSSRKTVLVLEHRYSSLLDIVDGTYRLREGVLEAFRPEPPLLERGSYPSVRRDDGHREAVALVEGVDVAYAERAYVLRGVTVRIARDELVAVYGRNGSGKSTFLKVLAGYVRPRKGRVRVYGRAFYVPQLPYLLFTEGSVAEEVRVACSGDPTCVRRGLELVERLVGLGDPGCPPFILSWGQQVRLAVALAIASRSSLLLLDEPFSGLTYPDRLKLSALLREVPGAKVVTLASRESLAILAPDRVLEISNGTIRGKEA